MQTLWFFICFLHQQCICYERKVFLCISCLYRDKNETIRISFNDLCHLPSEEELYYFP